MRIHSSTCTHRAALTLAGRATDTHPCLPSPYPVGVTAWSLATVAVAGYGLASAVWQLMLASLAFNALETAGTIVWATAKQRHVPAALLGRVSSLDWLVSIGLVPLSYALTGPVSALLGPGPTMIAAGLVGSLLMGALLFFPGVRDPERGEVPVAETAGEVR